jgi:uncharacterized protein YkwD
MPIRNRLAVPILVAAVLASAVAAMPSSAEATTVPRLINIVRAHHGLRALRNISSLQNSSHAWARRMMNGGFFGHAYHAAVAHKFHVFGENIGITFGRTGPSRIVRMWMNSPEHRSLILSRRWHYIGAGSVGGVWRGHRGARTWVLRFGT